MKKLAILILFILCSATVAIAYDPVGYWDAEPIQPTADKSGNHHWLSVKGSTNSPDIVTSGALSGSQSFSFLGDWTYYGKEFYMLMDSATFSELGPTFPCKYGTTNTSFTLLATVSINAGAVDRHIMSKWNTGGASSWRWYYNGATGNLMFVQKTSGGSETWTICALSTSHLYHIAVSYDDSTKTGVAVVYNPGVGSATYTHDFTNNITVSNASFMIGSYLTNGFNNNTEQGFFAGKLDDLAIYNVAMNESELQSITTSPPVPKPPFFNNPSVLFSTDFEVANPCASIPTGYYSSTYAFRIHGFAFDDCATDTNPATAETKYVGEILSSHGRNGTTGYVRWVRNYQGSTDSYGGIGGYSEIISIPDGTIFTQQREIWSRWWQKMPSVYSIIMHTGAKYVGDRARTAGAREGDFFEVNSAGMNNGYIVVPSAENYGLPSASVVTNTTMFDADGQWHCYEVGARLSTTGNADGFLQLWKDGVKTALTNGAVNIDGFNMGTNASDPSTYISTFVSPGFGNAFLVTAGAEVADGFHVLTLPTNDYYPVEIDDYMVSTTRMGCEDPPIGHSKPTGTGTHLRTGSGTFKYQ